MKIERQAKILAIIKNEVIETQDRLIERLREEGVEVAQATISRDIKQLRIYKAQTGDGHYRYAISPRKAQLGFADRLRAILRESITGVDRAQNLVMLKTMPGLAGAAGAAFDALELAPIVGTLAGDDTLLVVLRDAESAAELCAELEELKETKAEL